MIGRDADCCTSAGCIGPYMDVISLLPCAGLVETSAGGDVAVIAAAATAATVDIAGIGATTCWGGGGTRLLVRICAVVV